MGCKTKRLHRSLLDVGAADGGDDPLAAAGEEEGIADFLEGFEVVRVDRGVDAYATMEDEEGGEKGKEEIHGREGKKRGDLEKSGGRGRGLRTASPPLF